MAKYGATLANQNTLVNNVARQYWAENSSLTLPVPCPDFACSISDTYVVDMYLVATPRASASLPLFHIHCGDSGIPNRPISSRTAMNVLVPMMNRQPRSVYLLR